MSSENIQNSADAQESVLCFPMPTTSEIVPLPESSTVLHLLFQFINYHDRHPSTEHLNYDSLMLLLDAAQRYGVVWCIRECRAMLSLPRKDYKFQSFLDINGRRTLQYAASHGYRELVCKLAPGMIDTPLSELIGVLPLDFLPAMGTGSFSDIRYTEQWARVARDAYDLPQPQNETVRQHHDTCTRWRRYVDECRWKFRNSPSKLKGSEVEKTFQLHFAPNCDICRDEGIRWCHKVKTAVRAIEPFSFSDGTSSIATQTIQNSSVNRDIPQVPDSDIIIRSSDRVLFHLNKALLEKSSDAFPPAETPTNGEVISLPEPSSVLEVLFQFVDHNRHYPLIEDLDYDSLMLLVEAAEKYAISSCIYECRRTFIRPREDSMYKSFLELHPKPILQYAASHNYRELIPKLAPIMIDTPTTELLDVLTPEIFGPWSFYREQWLTVALNSFDFPATQTCTWWREYVEGCRQNIRKLSNLKLEELNNTFRVRALREQDCTICGYEGWQWYESVKNAVGHIRPLSYTFRPSA
ncbi:hypothetical protein BT96DRAFT_929703 [Gymnopus androsaceus JB14]|uniref:BTB domain-containing protein n=1 Tax=Gymnopus androsaceus JB14 TaxID=1447944 RepID=A0A6A4GDP8_9AGAR|nr:hypothetical protein BT96DRAFT_929703 [Gymnopus androsaceus JB14]